MKKLVIHIGIQKTATTYLQQNIFPSYTNTTYLTRPFTQYNHAFNKLQYADSSLYSRNELKKTLEDLNSGNQTIVISDENFAGKLIGYSYINRELIAQRLAELSCNHDIHVIIFIRGQRSMIRSLYNQAVKGHLKVSRTIDQFYWYPKDNYDVKKYHKIGNGLETMSLDHLYYNTNEYYVHLNSFLYYQLVSLYKSLFKNVHVFTHEEFCDNPKKVLGELDNIVGEKNLSTTKNLNVRINTSIPPKDLYERTLFNRYHNITSRIPFAHNFLKLYARLSKYKKRVFTDRYEAFLSETPKFYSENNRKIIEDFPLIGIQDYPDDYLVSQ